MAATTSLIDRLNHWVRHSVTVKLLSIGFLLLLLLIPSSMVESLITERAETRDAATREISEKWGGPQLVLGPVLAIPYTVRQEDERQRVLERTEYLCFLPDTLTTTGNLTPEQRHRGIYEAIVYRSRLQVRGVFQSASLADLDIAPADIHWSEAFVAVGISDMKGIRNGLRLTWDGQPRAFEPGVPGDALPQGSAPAVSSLETAVQLERARYSKGISYDDEAGRASSSGVSVAVPIADAAGLARRHTFAFDLDLNGSTGLLLAPLGRQTTAHLTAPWPDPSFTGAFLPVGHHIDGKGFTADWRVLHLNRNYPQRWRTSTFHPDVDASTFGVRLLIPVNEYQKTMRAAKYALLPLTLTFLIFFFVEVLNRRRIHPFQYILVGLALVIFYVLLLALSEHLAFNAAYLLAGGAVVGLITAYAAAIFRQSRLTLITAGVLLLVYLFVFVIIQLQDYALLIGSLGLLLILGLVMYLSRRIDWYAESVPGTPTKTAENLTD